MVSSLSPVVPTGNYCATHCHYNSLHHSLPLTAVTKQGWSVSSDNTPCSTFWQGPSRVYGSSGPCCESSVPVDSGAIVAFVQSASEAQCNGPQCPIVSRGCIVVCAHTNDGHRCAMMREDLVDLLLLTDGTAKFGKLKKGGCTVIGECGTKLL